MEDNPQGEIVVQVPGKGVFKLRALTVDDAAWIADLAKAKLTPRDKTLRLIHHQIALPVISEAGLAAWDDSAVIHLMSEWSRDRAGFDKTIDALQGFESVAGIIEAFASQWNAPVARVVAASPTATLSAVAKHPIYGAENSFGINRLIMATKAAERGAMKLHGISPWLLKEMSKAYEAAKWAQEHSVSVSLARDLMPVDQVQSVLWNGIGLGEHLTAIQGAVEKARSDLLPSIMLMSRTTLLAETALAGVDLRSITQRLAIPDLLASEYLTSLGSHFGAHERLLFAVADTPDGIDTRLGFELPAIEVFNEGELARVLARSEGDVSTHDERQERSNEIRGALAEEIPTLLGGIAPDLVRLWEGARGARHSGNVDRARHILVSFRTLMDELLNLLAPQEDVKVWGGVAVLLPDGRVQRDARFRYLARRIRFKQLRTAVEANLVSLNKTYGMLNSLHDPELDMSDSELGFVITRFEGAIREIVEIENAYRGQDEAPE